MQGWSEMVKESQGQSRWVSQGMHSNTSGHVELSIIGAWREIWHPMHTQGSAAKVAGPSAGLRRAETEAGAAQDEHSPSATLRNTEGQCLGDPGDAAAGSRWVGWGRWAQVGESAKSHSLAAAAAPCAWLLGARMQTSPPPQLPAHAPRPPPTAAACWRIAAAAAASAAAASAAAVSAAAAAAAPGVRGALGRQGAPEGGQSGASTVSLGPV